jgi:hypothetical protein
MSEGDAPVKNPPEFWMTISPPVNRKGALRTFGLKLTKQLTSGPTMHAVTVPPLIKVFTAPKPNAPVTFILPPSKIKLQESTPNLCVLRVPTL